MGLASALVRLRRILKVPNGYFMHGTDRPYVSFDDDDVTVILPHDADVSIFPRYQPVKITSHFVRTEFIGPRTQIEDIKQRSSPSGLNEAIFRQEGNRTFKLVSRKCGYEELVLWAKSHLTYSIPEHLLPSP